MHMHRPRQRPRQRPRHRPMHRHRKYPNWIISLIISQLDSFGVGTIYIMYYLKHFSIGTLYNLACLGNLCKRESLEKRLTLFVCLSVRLPVLLCRSKFKCLYLGFAEPNYVKILNLGSLGMLHTYNSQNSSKEAWGFLHNPIKDRRDIWILGKLEMMLELWNLVIESSRWYFNGKHRNNFNQEPPVSSTTPSRTLVILGILTGTSNIFYNPMNIMLGLWISEIKSCR